MAKSPGRKRPLPRSREGGLFGYNLGPFAQDGRSGFLWQRRYMTYQRGVLVHRSYTEGTRDRPDSYAWLLFSLLKPLVLALFRHLVA